MYNKATGWHRMKCWQEEQKESIIGRGTRGAAPAECDGNRMVEKAAQRVRDAYRAGRARLRWRLDTGRQLASTGVSGLLAVLGCAALQVNGQERRHADGRTERHQLG